jgi:acetylornithine deacetylase/succinyl-diaminopimelate desuccinylase-like protein
VLVGLKGADGRITIPELYSHLPALSDEERALWDRNPVDVIASMKEEMGVDYLPGEQEYDPRERQTARPTLEVHGIRGGFVDEGAKTVIPAEATAKVSLRLPPGLTPRQVFPWLERRVAALCPPGVTMTVREIHGGDPVLVPLENVYMRAAERALQDEWGRPPVFERSGGSIPVGALFDSVLHLPVIFMGTGLPDDNVHAPNEKYSIPNFYHLIRQAARFLDLIGSDPAIVSRPHAGAAASKNGNAGRQVGGEVPGVLPEEVEDDVTGPAPTHPAGASSGARSSGRRKATTAGGRNGSEVQP